MVKTLVAIYNDAATAQCVVEALLEAGFSGDDISLLVNDPQGTAAISSSEDVTAREGVSFGALVGTLVGIGSALVPGLGPVIGIGPLGVALTAGIGAVAGALTGGITAELLELGLDEKTASYYSDALHRGSTVVSVTTNKQWIEWAERIMARFHPLTIEEREAKWYTSEWVASDSYAEERAQRAANTTPFNGKVALNIQQPDEQSSERQNGTISSTRLKWVARIYDNP